MIKFLTQPTTLWVLFGLLIAQTLGFGVIMALWDFTIIDEMYDPIKIGQHISEMSYEQRIAHAWTTATLDVAYPFTYGALFAGLSIRIFRPVFAIPAIAVIPTDLTEGLVQVLALIGNDHLLWLKAYVTPLKLVLFTAAMLIALCAIGVELKNRKKRKV